MGTRIVDRHGVPYPTREVRQRMGFIPGELNAEGSEPPTFSCPQFSMPALNNTSDGENEPPAGRKKGR